MHRRGRIVGMVVFTLGIAVVLLVFVLALFMFTSPASELLPAGTPGAPQATAAGLGSAVVLLIIRIALLFAMTLAGSVVAGKGIQLYLGSRETPNEETKNG